MNIPKRLLIRNFLSIEEFEYFFKEGETVAIKGQNLTDKGKRSNGSGKSSIQQAIEFLHKGSCSRKTTNGKLVRRGSLMSMLEIEYFNTKTQKSLIITRTIPLKDSTTLKIQWNGVDVPFEKVDSGNDWLVQYFGIEKEDMASFYFPNEVSFIPFFLSSNTKKVAFVNRFSGANLIDSSKAKIERDIDLLVEEKGGLEKELAKLQAKAELIQESIDGQDSEAFEKEKLQRVERVFIEIGGKEAKQSEVSQYLANILKKVRRERLLVHPKLQSWLKAGKSLAEVEETLSAPKPDNVVEAEATSKSVEELKGIAAKEKAKIKLELQEVSRKLSSVEKELLGVIICPKCSYEFFHGDNRPVDDVRKEKEEIEKKVKDFETRVLEKESNLKDCDNMLQTCNIVTETYTSSLKALSSQYQEVLKNFNTLTSELNKARSAANMSLSLAKATRKSCREIDVEIAELHAKMEKIRGESLDPTLLEKSKLQLEEVQKDIYFHNAACTQKDVEIAEVTQWLTIMKRFKQELANEKLRVIQGLANHHLEEMGVDVQLKIDGYKLLASGEIREEITGYVIDKGEIVEYPSQSKGERIRIDYAIILAIRSLLNASSESGGIDLLFSDEITEGLDDLGTESLLETLSKTDNTILFTTHVLPDNIFPNMLYVRKINDVSQITEN